MSLDINTYDLQIKGLVQGVGFRPFVYRLAGEMGLKGYVENRNDGVSVRLSCKPADVEIFSQRLLTESPPAAQIILINKADVPREHFSEFSIRSSRSVSGEITLISPDIAVCSECLQDMEVQPGRTDYPLINCTHCGPRFTITRELPYDRPNTTMDVFPMCDDCRSEYENVADRRFHAQPVACKNCGPVYRLFSAGKTTEKMNEILAQVSEGIRSGKVYAVKGTGGYHLMCDAKNETAVNKIREIKNRDGKPFAIMVSSLDFLRTQADISPEEAGILESWRRPIVLLSYKDELAGAVSKGLDRVGVMLPYMPFHFLLFRHIPSVPLVLTSGNISEEPVIIEDSKALEVFGRITDGVLSYNRDIHNRADDSVCAVINRSVRLIRRSRGYAPSPVLTGLKTEGIFGAGAELSNSFCIGKGDQAIFSQYIGDLKNTETMDFYGESFERFSRLFRFKPELIAVDHHPDYLSTGFGQALSAKNGVPLLKVQHHHAHIASAMLTNGIDSEVIGISLDGTGAGTDGHIWGGEFLVAELDSFERYRHFEYVPMPGGDAASKETGRMALAYLNMAYGDELFSLPLPVLEKTGHSKAEQLLKMIRNGINSPLASSAGRLFDAVASLTGICSYNSFHSEAAMKLESAIEQGEKGEYGFVTSGESISFIPMIRSIVQDISKGTSAGKVSARFHNTVVRAVTDTCRQMKKERGISRVVLSGGSFQNRFLSGKIETELRSAGFEVYFPSLIPANDQGIALGQLAVAAKRRERGLIG